MDNKYNKALVKLLKSEGVYSVDIKDPGGETVFGVARKRWPKWEGWEYVDALKKNSTSISIAHVLAHDTNIFIKVKDFYYKYFWQKLRCNQMEDKLAEAVFDTGVNLGKKPAIRLLQRTFNVFFNGNLIVDGLIGRKTISALRSIKDIYLFRKMFLTNRISLYIHICHIKPVNFRFIKGWINRTIKYM